MTNDPAKNPYTARSGSDGGGGFSAGGANTIAAFAMTGSIISLGLVGGVVAISAAMAFFVLSDPPEDASLFRFGGDDLIFLVIGYVVFIAGAAAAVALRGVMKGQAVATYRSSNTDLPKPLDTSTPLPVPAQSLLGIVQTYTIVGEALLEGPAVLNAILMFIGDNFAHAIPIVLSVIGIVLQMPTASRLKGLLEDASPDR